MTADFVWIAWILLGTAYEGWTWRNKTEGDMLSQRIRSWLRVRTSTVHAWAWTVGWVGFAAWFLFHIL